MRFENQTFKSQAVELDFNQFVRCHFENCNIVVRGLSQLSYMECTFDACNFHFDGPAALVIGILRDLHASIPSVGEMAIRAIKGEVQPSQPH